MASMLLERGQSSIDNVGYERVYDLLEEHTYTWVTDAWKKRPVVDAIKRRELPSYTLDGLLRVAHEHGLDPSKARAALERRKDMVLISVNGVDVVVSVVVADEIEAALSDGQD